MLRGSPVSFAPRNSGQPLTRYAALLVALGIPLFVWAGLIQLQRASNKPEVVRIERAAFRVTGAGAEWMPVWLPHDWQRAGIRAKRGEYRYSVELSSVPPRPLAILLPRLGATASLYLNGEPLTEGIAANGRYWNQPVFYPLPRTLLVPGQNDFVVRVEAERGAGMLREIYIGPQDLLAADFARQRFVDVLVVQALIPLTAFGALFMAALALRQRHRSLGGYALLFAIWPLHALHCLIDEIPRVPAIRIGIVIALLGLLSLVAPLLYRLAGRVRRLERVYIGYSVAGSALLAALAAIDPPLFHWCSHRLWHNGLTLVAVFGFVAIIRGAARGPQPGAALLLGSALLLLSFGWHDWLVQNDEPRAGFAELLDHARPYALIVFGYVTLAAFLLADRKLNDELERRLERQQAELLLNYERLRKLERERLLAEERSRIMRDMHDGVGGQMVSMLASIETGRTSLSDISEALGGALEDLRVMIDSLDPSIDSVAAALGQLRSRIERQLNRAGIALTWTVEETPPLDLAGPGAILNVLRLVQEAINNVIRHSRATSLTVSLIRSTSGAFLEIRDNGQGIGAAMGKGRGLSNVRRRAAALGGRLDLESSPAGTVLRLNLPCADSVDLLTPLSETQRPIAVEAHRTAASLDVSVL